MSGTQDRRHHATPSAKKTEEKRDGNEGGEMAPEQMRWIEKPVTRREAAPPHEVCRMPSASHGMAL